MTLIPVSEYNRITGQNETLQSDEVLSCTPRGKAFSGTVKFGDDAYKIKHTVDVFPTIDSYSAFTSNYSYYIVSDEKPPCRYIIPWVTKARVQTPLTPT